MQIDGAFRVWRLLPRMGQGVPAGSEAMHFNSIAIGVGSALMPKVVRQASTPAKYSAYSRL
jgi:hypothetical protein